MSTSFILGVANASSVVMGKTIGSGDKRDAINIKNKLLFIYLILGITTATILLLIKNPLKVKANKLARYKFLLNIL